jgi:hypothetical protein
MPTPTRVLAPRDEPATESPFFHTSNADAAAYIEELLGELAEMARIAGHHGLSDAIVVAALQAARAAARSADTSA